MIAAAIMRQAEQRIFRCDRFRRNGVQSGSGDLSAAQGFGKGGAGHKVAAGSVDDECTVLHARQKTCVHHVHGLRCDRQMQAEDIAAFLYRFKSCIFRMVSLTTKSSSHCFRTAFLSQVFFFLAAAHL